MIRVFRICKTKHLATAFGGDGARIHGGRWNSPGRPAVYTSSSLSLATLEVMVHLEDSAVFARLFSWIEARIPDDAIETADISRLPPGWRDDEIAMLLEQQILVAVAPPRVGVGKRGQQVVKPCD